MTGNRARRRIVAWAVVVCVAASGLTALAAAGSQTIIYSRGQNIAPAFEGWERNADGTFSLWFGYMNRNMDEKLHIPVGPHNRLEPGPLDGGQPTWFQPRRNRYMFRVVVPPDFGDREVVWSVTAHGRTDSAYGSLRVDYVVDKLMKMMDTGGVGVAEVELGNMAPVVRVTGDTERTVRADEPLALQAFASDDGIPARMPAMRWPPVKHNAWGLRVSWYVYRGDGDQVTFEPEQVKVYPDYRGNSPWTPGWLPPLPPADGLFPVTATFREPGTYVLRVMAHDGGSISNEQVTVTVRADQTSAP